MSDAVFPKLRGLSWDVKAIPTWSTVVQTSKSRARTALMNDPQPLWTFEVTYEFLRDTAPQRPGGVSNPLGYTELEQLVGFYNQHGGRFDDFLLDPGQLTGRPDKSQVRGAVIGTGDGATTDFQLQREYCGFMEWIENPVGAIFISVNGAAATSGWTLGGKGVVTFATAPADGYVITADFQWRYRVAFAEDNIGDLSAFMRDLYELQSLKLEQVPL